MRLPMLLEAIREGDDGKLFQFLNTSEWLTAAEIFASSTEDSGPGKFQTQTRSLPQLLDFQETTLEWIWTKRRDWRSSDHFAKHRIFPRTFASASNQRFTCFKTLFYKNNLYKSFSRIFTFVQITS